MGAWVIVVQEQESENDNEVMHPGNTDESVTIHPNGDFKITGATVNSVDASSNSVNGSLYGLSKTVSLNGATITGGGKTISVSDIQAGDKLSASGNFNETTHAIEESMLPKGIQAIPGSREICMQEILKSRSSRLFRIKCYDSQCGALIKPADCGTMYLYLSSLAQKAYFLWKSETLPLLRTSITAKQL